MSDLAAVRDQLRLLTRRHIDDPGRDLKPACLVLIDAMATYVSREHGELPQSIAGLLHRAMIAAMRADVATVIEQVELALTEAGLPLPSNPKRRPSAGPGAPRTPRPSPTKTATAKPVAETIDPLLAKLRVKHGRK